jgi:hypothetical protein
VVVILLRHSLAGLLALVLELVMRVDVVDEESREVGRGGMSKDADSRADFTVCRHSHQPSLVRVMTRLHSLQLPLPIPFHASALPG